MAKLTRGDRMTIKSLTGRSCSNRHIARFLGVSEGTVRKLPLTVDRLKLGIFSR